MQDAVYIDHNDHRTFLKWHRGRRKASDTAFTATRILEAMRIGASVEVDLRVHRDRGFAVLHDRSVERETTGRGFVADLAAEQLRQMTLRDNSGRPTHNPVILLDDLARLLSREVVHPDAMLQLDFKEQADVLDAETVAHFASTLAPFAKNLILSSGDAAAVSMLSAALPAMQTGYDPCDDDVLEALASSRNYAGFVADAMTTAPQAQMIYLHYPVILEAAKHGFDLVAAFHARGFRIDAWTIETTDEVSLNHVKALLDCQVDQITTDDPEGLQTRIAAWAKAA